jgi:YfiH family protein
MRHSEELNRIGLRHGISTKRDGNMSFNWDDQDTVNKNRTNFSGQLNLQLSQTVVMKVEHKDRIAIVDKSYGGRGVFTDKDAVMVDALITNKPDVNLWLMVADCLPVILYEPGKVLALVHLGWKSTDLRLATKTVTMMKQQFSSNAANIVAFLGPCIKPQSYIFNDPIQQTLPGWGNYLANQPDGRTAIDIVGFNTQQLLDSGITSDNIQHDPTDTAQSNTLFSHYRSSRTGEFEGRFAIVAAM